MKFKHSFAFQRFTSSSIPTGVATYIAKFVKRLRSFGETEEMTGKKMTASRLVCCHKTSPRPVVMNATESKHVKRRSKYLNQMFVFKEMTSGSNILSSLPWFACVLQIFESLSKSENPIEDFSSTTY